MLIGAAAGWQAALVAALAAGVVRACGGRPFAACLASLVPVVGWHPLSRLWGMFCRGPGAG